MKKIVISGLSICDRERITGIERTFREVLLRLDNLIENSDLKIEYIVTKGASNKIIPLNDLKNIKVVEFKKHKILNKMVFLPHYIKKNHAVGLCLDLSFLLSKKYIASVYDLRPYVCRNYDAKLFKLKFNRIFLPLVKLYSGFIVTDSNFQRNLIIKHLKYKPERVKVIYLGWEHINEVEQDNDIFIKNSAIKPHEYYYTIGSIAPHKNLRWIYEIAKRHPEQTFVIAGGKNIKLWGDSTKEYNLKNIIYPGYVSDAENKALMSNCKAFLFPSKFEGFGIPPLEALACGAPICVANTTCLPEIYGNCAHYFESDDYNVDLDSLLKQSVENPQRLLTEMSWSKVALNWLELLLELSKD